VLALVEGEPGAQVVAEIIADEAAELYLSAVSLEEVTAFSSGTLMGLEKLIWQGRVTSVQPRIQLMRSFDQPEPGDEWWAIENYGRSVADVTAPNHLSGSPVTGFSVESIHHTRGGTAGC